LIVTADSYAERLYFHYQVFFTWFSPVCSDRCNIALKLDIKSSPFLYLHYMRHNFSFFHASPNLAGLGLLLVEISRSHSDTPNSVGILWASDRHVSGTSTWQYTTLTRDRHPCPGGIRTRSHSIKEFADSRLRPRANRGWRYKTCNVKKLALFIHIRNKDRMRWYKVEPDLPSYLTIISPFFQSSISNFGKFCGTGPGTDNILFLPKPTEKAPSFLCHQRAGIYPVSEKMPLFFHARRETKPENQTIQVQQCLKSLEVFGSSSSPYP